MNGLHLLPGKIFQGSGLEIFLIAFIDVFSAFGMP